MASPVLHFRPISPAQLCILAIISLGLVLVEMPRAFAEQSPLKALYKVDDQNLQIGDKTYSRKQIIDDFEVVTRGRSLVAVQYSSRISIEGIKALHDQAWWRKHYPWLSEFIYRDSDAGPADFLNKWDRPIKISFGLPLGLLSATNYSTIPTASGRPRDWARNSQENQFIWAPLTLWPSQATLTELEEFIETQSPELSKITGLDIRYIRNSDETAENLGNLRIIFLDHKYFPSSANFKTTIPAGIENTPIGRSGSINWYAHVMPQLETAIHFTPGQNEDVSGYFLSNSEGDIGLAVCELPSAAPPPVLKTLVSKCLLRSLGLPDESTVADPFSILSARSMGLTAAGLSAYDKLLLRLLYDPQVKAESRRADSLKVIADLLNP